jgi:serine/threonine protein kinase
MKEGYMALANQARPVTNQGAHHPLRNKHGKGSLHEKPAEEGSQTETGTTVNRKINHFPKLPDLKSRCDRFKYQDSLFKVTPAHSTPSAFYSKPFPGEQEKPVSHLYSNKQGLSNVYVRYEETSGKIRSGFWCKSEEKNIKKASACVEKITENYPTSHKQAFILTELRNEPNILKMFGASNNRHDRKYSIVTEMADTTLAKQSSHLSSESQIDCIKDMVSALKSTHQAGVCHGDIRPEHYYGFENPSSEEDIPASHTYKLGHFDQSFFMGEAIPPLPPDLRYQHPRRVLGSPELKDHPERIDLWSLGISMAEALLGDKATAILTLLKENNEQLLRNKATRSPSTSDLNFAYIAPTLLIQTLDATIPAHDTDRQKLVNLTKRILIENFPLLNEKLPPANRISTSTASITIDFISTALHRLFPYNHQQKTTPSIKEDTTPILETLSLSPTEENSTTSSPLAKKFAEFKETASFSQVIKSEAPANENTVYSDSDHHIHTYHIKGKPPIVFYREDFKASGTSGVARMGKICKEGETDPTKTIDCVEKRIPISQFLAEAKENRYKNDFEFEIFVHCQLKEAKNITKLFAASTPYIGTYSEGAELQGVGKPIEKERNDLKCTMLMEAGKSDMNGALENPEKPLTGTPTALFNTCRDMTNGIREMHEKGFIHADFKPGNCLVFSDGTIKVSDFGHTFIQGQNICDNLTTYRYAHPMQAKEENSLQDQPEKIDLWSLAVSLSEVVLDGNTEKTAPLEKAFEDCFQGRAENAPYDYKPLVSLIETLNGLATSGNPMQQQIATLITLMFIGLDPDVKTHLNESNTPKNTLSPELSSKLRPITASGILEILNNFEKPHINTPPTVTPDPTSTPKEQPKTRRPSTPIPTKYKQSTRAEG